MDISSLAPSKKFRSHQVLISFLVYFLPPLLVLGLSQVDADLPSTEAWESLKRFLLEEDRTTDAATSTSVVCGNRLAAADAILLRLRISARSGWAGGRKGRALPLLRVIAVDFIVSLVRLEATPLVLHGEEEDPATSTSGWSAFGNASSAAAASAGVESVWRLLDALAKPTVDVDETAELLSVLGAPALADAVLDAEFAVGGAGGRFPGAPADGGGGEEGRIESSVRNRFPLASAAVERLKELSRRHRPLPSSSRSPLSARVLEACASGLVSFAAAAFRRCSSYREDGSGSSGDARGKALSMLARHAADGALRSPPALRLLSGEDLYGDGGRIDGEESSVRIIFPQLRALATVHSWPRQRLALSIARRLGSLPPSSPLAVDLAVLESHIVGAGFEGNGGGHGEVDAAGSSRGATVNTVEGLLLDLLIGRRFTENPKVTLVGSPARSLVSRFGNTVVLVSCASGLELPSKCSSCDVRSSLFFFGLLSWRTVVAIDHAAARPPGLSWSHVGAGAFARGQKRTIVPACLCRLPRPTLSRSCLSCSPPPPPHLHLDHVLGSSS